MKLLLTLLALGLSVGLAQGRQDTFIVQSTADVNTLDPAQAYDIASGQIIENVYETLYGYKGESVTEYEPRLATAYKVSSDNLTFTFTLRKGVKFHSGNPFSCKDVEYSLKRLLVVNPADSGGWILMEPLTGYYGNATAELGDDATDKQYADFYKKIDQSVTCPDGSDGFTVQFNLAQADPAFFAKTIFYGASIVDKAWAVKNGMWDGTEATWREWIGADLRQHYLQDHMSGTGAYQLVNWQTGDRVIAEAFPDYWGGAPKVQNVQVQIVDDQAARILALQQGDADVVGLERAALSQVEGQPGITVRDAATDPSLNWSSTLVSAVFMNQAVVADNNASLGSGKLDGQGIPADFFSDENMRKCINYSFDPEAYIDQVLQGYGQKLTMALPPSYLGYDPEVPTYSYDPDAAEKACRAAWNGQVWEKGFQFTITYSSGTQAHQAVAEIIKSNLEFLNPKFKVQVRGIAWPDFLDQSLRGFLPVVINGWIPDFADPDNYMHTFYQTDGYYANSINFSDKQIDAWDKRARSSFDVQERVKLYRQIAERGYDLSTYVLLPQGVPFLVQRANLKGTYVNPMLSGAYLWRKLSKN